jgi:uncharacterized RDD family membrane protein YckC
VPIPTKYTKKDSDLRDELLYDELLQDRQRNPTYASFFSRLVAFLIDNLILLIPMFVVDANLPQRFSDIGLIYMLVVHGLYFTTLESSAGQATIGKKLLGLKVVDKYGDRINFATALYRYLFKHVSAYTLMIGFFIAAFSPKRQALHDKAADTLVVLTKEEN